MKIWITGASGMLARDLSEQASMAGHICLGTDLDVDITDRTKVSNWLDAHPVDWVVNCAAYTAVDKAETDEDRAFLINAKGPENLAIETSRRDLPLIHISTDYVLNGAAPDALREDAPLDPHSAYGRTKAKGEVRIATLNPKHWIVRTAWLYGIHGNNFVKTMLRLMSERDQVKVVDDQWGSPTWTVDLAHAILGIIGSGRKPGTYHYSDDGKITWCTFAREIQRQAIEFGLLKRAVPIEAIPSSAFPSPTVRPTWSVLDKSRIRRAFSVEVPSWEASLNSYLQLEVAARD